MKACLFLVVSVAVFLSGCATDPEAKREHYSQKIQDKYRGRIRVMPYDSEKRSQTEKVDFFDGTTPIPREVKELALMTCDAYAFEETDIAKLFRWQAGQLGADAVVMVTRANYQKNDPLIIGSGGGFGGGGSGRTVFRAKALIYIEQK